MLWVLGVSIILSALAAFVSTYAEGVLRELSTEKVYGELASVVRSGLHITRSALSQDWDWNDCNGADANCNDPGSCPEGYFPLYSQDLGLTVEDFSVEDWASLTVCISPVNSSRVRVIAIARNANNYEKVVLGAVFRRVSSSSGVPLAYAGSYMDVLGGVACSRFWDGTAVAGPTLPNFSVYIPAQEFRFSADILVPDDPAGDNPKDVRFFTNFSTVVSGYDVIDGLWTVGDVYLENGAYVRYVEATGQIYTDASSGCDVCVENSDWQFPPFNNTLEDNVIPDYGGQNLWLLCNGQTYDLPGGVYRAVYVLGDGGKCRINFLGEVWVENFYAGVGVWFFGSENNDIELVLNGNLTVDNLYVLNSNTLTVLPSSPVLIKGDLLSVSNGGRVICRDPRLCLFDFNVVYNYCYFCTTNLLQGIVVARNYYFALNSTQIGNVFAERLRTINATLCNVVDSNGDQVLPDESLGFYSIVSGAGSFDPITTAVYETICPDEEACVQALAEQ